MLNILLLKYSLSVWNYNKIVSHIGIIDSIINIIVLNGDKCIKYPNYGSIIILKPKMLIQF